MSTLDRPAPKAGMIKRAWNFILELWDVLIRPSSVYIGKVPA